MNSAWVYQAVGALLLITPAWLAVGFFQKIYQVSSEAFMVWYFVGILLAAVFMSPSSENLLPSGKAIVGLVLAGIFLGGLGNILLFRAVAAAPNPGLPLAIANATSITVFVASAGLALLLPKYFPKAEFDWWSALAIILTFLGTGMIVFRK